MSGAGATERSGGVPPEDGGPIGVGIIGYGYAGEVIHAPLVEAAPGLELRAVSTGRSDRADLARSRGLVVHPDAGALLADETVALVVLATPHDTHLPLTRAAAKAGRHVVCDKLMALSIGEAEAMVAAAREAGVMLSVFHNRRWDGDFLAARAALAGTPSLGSLIRIRSWVHAAGAPNPEKWRASRAHGGGIFSDWGAHLMDQALLLHDAPAVRVTCSMSYAVPGVDVESAAFCGIEFADRSLHLIETNQLYHAASKGYEVWGSEARLIVEGFDPRENLLNQEVRGVERSAGGYRARLFTPAGERELDPPAPGDWAAFYRNVGAHLLRDEPLAVTPESVVRMMRLREAALRSAADHTTVAVEI